MKAREDVFRFKKFQIIQNQNVHRVGTDGVLLGAWVKSKRGINILDVGTGTGLIAMMLAQRCKQSFITAIEPDQEAFDLAWQNVRQSPFSDRIKVINTSLQNFQTEVLFDLIVCNPPFFVDSLKPLNENRVRQRHSDTLPFIELIQFSKKKLSSAGQFCLILPVSEGNQFIKLALDAGFRISGECSVFSRETKKQERWLLTFTQAIIEPVRTSLTIMTQNGDWTPDYRTLTNDFYLEP